MKRKFVKKLELSKETVRVLDDMSLRDAVGALTGTIVCSACRCPSDAETCTC